MPATRRLTAALLLLVAASASLPLGGCATARSLRQRFPYAEGEQVTVQGVVTDDQGQPIPDVQVTLEASRMGFGVYPPGNRKREVVTGTTRSGRDGSYGLQFPWSDRLNHFELVAAIPVVVAGGGETPHELVRTDVTRRVAQGSPVAVPLAIADTKFLYTLREFVAGLQSPDENRVYREQGKPDRVDRTQFPDRVEAAWWYFPAGKVYRFESGRLVKVDDFDPVKPIQAAVPR